jgi:hypothetical protein
MPIDTAVGLFVAASSTIASVATLAWWLAGRFARVEQISSEMLDRHELLDQRRHEENLGKFEQLNVRLTRIEARANGR